MATPNKVIEIRTLGPQGPIGPQGPSGSGNAFVDALGSGNFITFITQNGSAVPILFNNFLGTAQTSSFITTASVNLNTITFTKGDNTTFLITVNTGSGGGGGGVGTLQQVTTQGASTTIPITASIISASNSITGSLFGTASWAQSASQANSSIISIGSLTAVNSLASDKIKLANATVDTDYGFVLKDGSGEGYFDLYQDSQVDTPAWNPSTNTFKASIISASSGFTGSLFGTASWAQSASNAINARTASFINNLNQDLSITGAVVLSGSSLPELRVIGDTQFTGSINSLNGYTGSLLGTSSWATNALTTLFAPGYVSSSQTSSFVTNNQTSSFITTASVNLNTITFTKGNNTAFEITVNTGSGGNIIPNPSQPILLIYTSSTNVSDVPSSGYIFEINNIPSFIRLNTQSYNNVNLAPGGFTNFYFSQPGSLLTVRATGSGAFKTYKVLNYSNTSDYAGYTVQLPYIISSGTINNGDIVEFRWDKSADVGNLTEGIIIDGFSTYNTGAIDLFFNNNLSIIPGFAEVNTLSYTGSGYIAASITRSADLIIRSLNVTNGITGSLLGTASYVQTAQTASYYQETDPIFIAKSASLATTGSNSFNGNQTITGSLIQGLGNTAGENSHAEGDSTQAIGLFSHAEGLGTIAYGGRSHAEGQDTIASGSYSHTEGYQTIALADHQHVQGQWNATSSIPAAFIVGNGTDDSNRSNLIHAAGNEVRISGSMIFSTGGITGSLFGTASLANRNILTASVSLNTLFFTKGDGTQFSLTVNTGSGAGGGVILGGDTNAGNLVTTVDTDEIEGVAGLTFKSPVLAVNNGIVATKFVRFSSSLAKGSSDGLIINYGSISTVEGYLYYLSSSNIWVTSSLTLTSGSLLAIATSTNSSGGMLLQGISSHPDLDNLTPGATIYLSGSGRVSQTAPTTSNQQVRVIGYGLSGSTFVFNPSTEYVTLA